MKPCKIDNETCDLMMGGDKWLSTSKAHDRIQGETGSPDRPHSPGKSQVNWASIGIQQSDPAPWKNVDPPTPLWKIFDPLEPWKIIVFFETVK